MAARTIPSSNEAIVKELDVHSLARVARINNAVSKALPHLTKIGQMFENTGTETITFRLHDESTVAECVGITNAYKAFGAADSGNALVMHLFDMVDRHEQALTSIQLLTVSIREYQIRYALPRNPEHDVRCAEALKWMNEVVEHRQTLEGILGLDGVVERV